jgi:hypothetical protein
MENKTADVEANGEQADGDGVTNESGQNADADHPVTGLQYDEPDFPSAQPRQHIGEQVPNEMDGSWKTASHKATKRRGRDPVDNGAAKRVALATADGKYTTTENNVDDDDVDNAGSATSENSDHESLILKRNKQQRMPAQLHRTNSGNGNFCNQNDKCGKHKPSTNAAVCRPAGPTRLEPISDIEGADGGPNVANNATDDEHHNAPGAKIINDKYHWHNMRNADNIAHINVAGDGRMRAQADKILAQTTGIFARVLRVIHNEEVVDRFFEPEKSSADAAEHVAYFESRFREAAGELTANVQVGTRNIPDGTEEERMELLTELVLMKEKIQNLLMRIRAESAGPFATNQRYDRAVAYKQLSDYGAISEKHNGIFNQISTALAGIHYAKLLDDIQRKIADVRSTLPNHRVLYATVAQQSVKDSRNKVDKLFRRLRPDLSVGRADSQQRTQDMPQHARTRERRHYDANAQNSAHASNSAAGKIAPLHTNTANDLGKSQNVQLRHSRAHTSADAQSTKPKQTYAQTVRNSDTNANSHAHGTKRAQSAKTENIPKPADQQTTKPKMPAAPVPHNDDAPLRTCHANTNSRNDSLLGRPPQHANNSVRTDWPADRPKPIRNQHYGERGHYQAGYKAGRSWNASRAYNGTNWDGSRSWMFNSWAGPAAQRYFPNWGGRNWHTDVHYAFCGPRYSSNAQTESNLHQHRDRMPQKFCGPYIGYADQVGRW